MADSNIGALPQAPQVDDDSLLVMEQQGQAMKLSGAQLKEYAKRGVELEFEEDLAQSQAAADRAVSAVEAVTGMTVEAHPSQTATVTKSTKDGRVNLNFGLPRGEQGVPGPEGKTGPRGPQGAPGNGLTILGHYDTEEALRAAVMSPKVGDPYSVGTELPYDTYIFDGVTNDWKNYGPFTGGGSVLPENVVTSEGGAELEIPETFGDAPHTIQFTEEEEPPLTADDIVYGDGSVGDALEGLKASVSDGKSRIASAITDKGVDTAQDASFAQMAENIGKISGGADTSDATAAAGDILAGKTAYTAQGKVEGQIPALGARTYTPGTAAQTIANGQYLSGVQTIQGDPNLTSGNIKKGVSIFGVDGAVEQSFLATLTVTADVGAVVTATHTSGTEVEALSTTGTVTMELPLEGQWTVTARRGVAQYNSVVVTVSSQYSAALTAEVHIKRYGVAASLGVRRYELAAASFHNCAVFAGGFIGNDGRSNACDVYDSNLVHTTPEELSERRGRLAAAPAGSFVLFGGGNIIGGVSDAVDAYNEVFSRSIADPLSVSRGQLSAAVIGNYTLFGGGWDLNNGLSVVDAYDRGLTRTEAKPLVLQASETKAAANENYAVFCGNGKITAYDSNLVRSTAVDSSMTGVRFAAARAGNYVLFAGDSKTTVEAYDLFLTRTTPEALSVSRDYLAGTTLQNFALFGGGYAKLTAMENVDVYDAFLVRTMPVGLNRARGDLAAATAGDYALFGGGRENNSTVYDMYNTVDVYQYV